MPSIWSKTDEPAAATAATPAAGHPSQAGHIVGAAGTHLQALCISHACMIQGESKMVIIKPVRDSRTVTFSLLYDGVSGESPCGRGG